MRSTWPLALICLVACEAPSSTFGVAHAGAPLHQLIARPEGAEPLPSARRRVMSPQQIAARVKTHPGALPSLAAKGGAALPLKHTRVSAELVGDVASVEVHQIYENPHTQPIEVVYAFPLPENSAVFDMEMRVEDRIIRAEIQRRADARRTYEAAKRAGRTAALLEQERPNLFTQSVANIPPGERVEVRLSYAQQLTYDAGEYEFVFPMTIGPRFTPDGGEHLEADPATSYARINPPILGNGERSGRDIELRLAVHAGLPIVDLATPTHEVEAHEADGSLYLALAPHDRVPNRDFVMRYRLEGAETRAALMAHKAGRTGYFSLLIEPPALEDLGARVGQRELIFVLDVSGSMSGAPLGQSKAAMHEILTKIQPADTFNVYTFSGYTSQLFKRPMPASGHFIKEAMRYVSNQRAGGGTMMSGAVKAALTPPEATDRRRYVFFLTDGYIGNEREIFAQSEALVKALEARGQRARVFSLGVGSSVNRHLLDGIARAGDGLASYLGLRDDPGAVVDRLFGVIDHPILSEISVDWGDLKVEGVTPSPLPSLFASRPLVLRGRYTRPGSATITINATSEGRPYHLPLKVTLPEREEGRVALPVLWARDRVTALERVQWRAPDAGIVEAITKLGLEHRLVTAYTSFVAVDTARRVEGPSVRVDQPNEAPEGVDMRMAGAPTPVMAVMPAAPEKTMRPAPRRRRMQRARVRSSASSAEDSPAPRMMHQGKDEVDDLLGGLDGSSSSGARRSPPAPAAAPALPVQLSRNQILRVIKRGSGAVKSCQTEGKGLLTARITISPEGKVTKVEILGDEHPDALKRCLEAKILRFRFPQFSGSPMIINMPFKI